VRIGDDEATPWFEVNYLNVTDANVIPGGVSAVGYFFAKHLRNSIGDVPIGIIQHGAGGTAIRHYLPKDLQWKDACMLRMNEPYWDNLVQLYGEEQLVAHEEAINAWLAGESSSQLCPVYISGFPGYLFYHHLPPLKNMKFKGLIYYQGESDAGRGQYYRKPLSALVYFYREYFDYSDMPFLVVMLPPYQNNNYAELVDSQLSVADEKSGVSAVYAPEAGDEFDIHPPKKEIIGQRAAMAALVEAYGGSDPYLGPRYQSDVRVGNTVTVTFKDTDGGLKLAAGHSVLTGFQLAGASGNFVDVTAQLAANPNDVEITIPTELQGEPTIYIRFNWTGYYVPVLYGDNDLPAVFFRTDDFDLLTTDCDL
jgi:sialate O-acetylesterase